MKLLIMETLPIMFPILRWWVMFLKRSTELVSRPMPSFVNRVVVTVTVVPWTPNLLTTGIQHSAFLSAKRSLLAEALILRTWTPEELEKFIAPMGYGVFPIMLR